MTKYRKIPLGQQKRGVPISVRIKKEHGLVPERYLGLGFGRIARRRYVDDKWRASRELDKQAKLASRNAYRRAVGLPEIT